MSVGDELEFRGAAAGQAEAECSHPFVTSSHFPVALTTKPQFESGQFSFILGLMTRFSVKMTAECQAGRGDEFPGRRSCAGKLPHRRL